MQREERPDAAVATGSVPVAPGGEPLLTYTVRVNSARDLVAADMLVRYDAGQVTLTRVGTTKATEGYMAAAADRDGLVRISMAGTRRLNGATDLLELGFKPRNDRNEQALPVEVVWLVQNENAGQRATGEGAMAEEKRLPVTFYLMPPNPNPLVNATTIRYGLPQASDVRLSVIDVTGRQVRTLVAGTLPAGRYTMTWDGKDNAGRRLANGVYYVRMKTGEYRIQHKLVLVRE